MKRHHQTTGSSPVHLQVQSEWELMSRSNHLWSWEEHQFAKMKSTEYFMQKYKRYILDWKDCKKNLILKGDSLAA